jgi:hypothetical protein
MHVLIKWLSPFYEYLLTQEIFNRPGLGNASGDPCSLPEHHPPPMLVARDQQVPARIE